MLEVAFVNERVDRRHDDCVNNKGETQTDHIPNQVAHSIQSVQRDGRPAQATDVRAQFFFTQIPTKNVRNLMHGFAPPGAKNATTKSQFLQVAELPPLISVISMTTTTLSIGIGSMVAADPSLQKDDGKAMETCPNTITISIKKSPFFEDLSKTLVSLIRMYLFKTQ